MTEVEPDELRKAVENMHGGRATLIQSVQVSESFDDQPVWEGTVHVFDLDGCPNATRAYAWSSPTEGSKKRRFFAVLHLGAIRGPVDAVRAAIVAEHGGMKKLTLLFPLLFLVACDDGPEARKNLAQCELDARAHTNSGSWNDQYLSTCMQGRGFVINSRLTRMCKDIDYPEIVSSCYRRDNWFAKFTAANFQDSN